MAETLRELVVALSLDSSHFSRNMRTINQQIKEAESTFRLAGTGVENYEKTIATLHSPAPSRRMFVRSMIPCRLSTHNPRHFSRSQCDGDCFCVWFFLVCVFCFFRFMPAAAGSRTYRPSQSSPRPAFCAGAAHARPRCGSRPCSGSPRLPAAAVPG